MGADAVASALEARGETVIRNGSRGMLWMEPLIERADERHGPRVGWSNVTAGQIDAGLPNEQSDNFIGAVEEVDYLARQNRWIYERVGITDPVDPEDYVAHGGLTGLKNALAMSGSDVVQAVTDSGLRGRGGAGFPAGIKWRTVADQAPAPHAGESRNAPAHKYICVNADEGDSGTFADRMLMEGDPFCLLEGMTIAAHAVGADRGLVYLRSEYPDAIAMLQSAIWIAREQGWLGDNILGSDLCFDVEIRVGAGSYVCGEETAMLESLEGRRGMVRAKPPLPAIKGLEAYAALGQNRSLGTQVFQLAGNIARGGIVETAFGISAKELIEDFGGGTRSGRPLRAVQLGGPLGAYLSPEKLDVAMEYEALIEAGGMIGHGGVVLFDDSVNMAEQARFAMDFCVEESCGKCTPCRIGAVRGVETIDKIRAGKDVEANTELLRDLCDVMTQGSLCAMGGLTPNPVLSALNTFPEDFASPVIATG